MNRKSLQISTALLATVPVVTGLVGLTGLHDPLYGKTVRIADNVLLDSNLRFFSGVWLGLGLALFASIPTIEKQTFLFRSAWGAIFLGGIGRLLSLGFVAVPPLPFVAFTLLEVVGAPLFVYWQHRVASASSQL